MRYHFFCTICSLVMASSAQASFMTEETPSYFLNSSHHPVKGPTGSYIYPVVSGSTGSVEYYYDPMIEDISLSQGVENYTYETKRLIVTSANIQESYNDYNHLVINDVNLLAKIQTSSLYTVREIEFAPNNSQSDQLTNQTLIEFLQNQTLISLSKIKLANFQVSINILSALKNMTFGDEAVIREKQFLDMQCGAAVAPIRLVVDRRFLENMKKEDLSVVKERLQPCKKYIPTIYMENLKEERLARLKVYLNS